MTSTASSPPASKMRSRRWLIYWLYGVAGAHIIVGVLLPWIMHADYFHHYHETVEQAFWGGVAPAAAREQQIWWMALFGPTVQSLAVWMAALIYLGQVHRSRVAWLALIVGVLIWAPQDIAISLQAGIWLHVWVDLVAVITMLPPLLWLWRMDGKLARLLSEHAP